MRNDTICFKDLSIPLKTAIIMAWIYGIVFGITFLVGFFQGLLGI